ncbi:hypothetical protein D9758_013167 [Tetrapyrgos nigripes]|uniref:Uncharacterized protein n=1 Tax=Tetrapyrgos nigripes TaxID=182062 RepID=A0A8H5FKN3_9AGAR|nr:hypothetical protein D9758_013167 [Tetrapyrgos nigripes]
MSFSSNLSAFGMKPATTNAPGTGTSIFGQPAKPPGAPIFGNTQPQGQQQQQPTTSVFGNTGNTGTNTNTNPLFGSSNVFGQQNQSNQQQQQPAAGTSVFGQSTQQPQPGTTGPGTSVFGQPAQQQPTTGTGTGIFGQSTGGTNVFGQPTQQQQQQQPSTGTNIFGQSQQQPAPGTSTGIFGQQQQSGGTSLFGQSQQQPATGTSLFGQQPQQQQQQPQSNPFGGSSMFGNAAGATNTGGTGLFGSTNNTAGGFGGNSMFGQKPAQASTFGQPTAPQQATGPLPFTKTTKFNDLPDEIKRMLEQIDSHIQGRIQISKDLQQRKLGEEPTRSQELIRSVHKDLTLAAATINNDLHVTRELKAKTDQAYHDAIIVTHIIDGARNQQQSAYLKDHAHFPLEFFTKITKQICERLVWYKATIDQIERKLSSMSNQTHITPQGITATLQAQHATFLSLAAKTATLDAELQKIKALYTQLWRARTGSVRDPFEGNGMDEDGTGGTTGLGMSMSGLSVG